MTTFSINKLLCSCRNIDTRSSSILCRFKRPNNTIDVAELSKLRLVCPNPTTMSVTSQYYPAKEEMYENIWIVDKHSYDTCNVNFTNQNNKWLFDCSNPNDLKYYTLVFQRYSPTRDGLTFKLGQTYYFICKFRSSYDSDQKSLKSENTADLFTCHRDIRHINSVIDKITIVFLIYLCQCFIVYFSIYQSNRYPFSRTLIGSRNSRYPSFKAQVKITEFARAKNRNKVYIALFL